MTNWGGLPPIDVGGWADYTRKRMQQEAAQRIAAAGAVAQDWQSKALRSIEQIGSDLTSGLQGVGSGVQEAGAAAFGGLQDIGQAAAQTVGQTFADPTNLGLAPPGETQVQTRGNAMFPDDPLAGIKYAGVQTGLGVNQAQAQSKQALDAMMGFGPQGPNLAAQALGAVDVGTTPYTALGRSTTAAASNLGASPETAAVAGGLAGTFGPGGITANIANRQALPLAGAAIGGVAGVGSGIAQERPLDETISRGFEGAQMGAGAGEILPALGKAGADALRYGASRFGADEGDAARAVAGRGRATTGSRFGIENADPEDVEGQVMARATGPVEDVRQIAGAPGSRRDAPGVPRTASPLSPMDPSLPERSAAEFVDGKRTAATPYEYLKGLAEDYANYRDFYPGFGRFYKGLADPAGGSADGLFNELGALWGATAAQTAPHDNLTKALKASIGARRFRDVVGRLPNATELYKLLMDGEIRPGLEVERVRANPKQNVTASATVTNPGEFLGKDPDSQLSGSARKLTMDDARKIVDTWEKGQITIPTNFKLSAFNILNALAARGEYSPFSVIDTHMFRLLGYGDEARKIKPGDLAGNPTASRYTQATVARLADDLGWEPHQVQSALWFGAKEEVAPRSHFTGTWTLKNDIPETGNIAGEKVEIGGLPYSIDMNRKLIDDFKTRYAPDGPINDLSGKASVVFPGATSGRGMPTFGLDEAAQQRANTWMENRGYTFTVDVTPGEARSLGFDPATGRIAALEARGIPAVGQQMADGSLAVQLYSTSDDAARAAAEAVTGITKRGEPIRPIRPITGPDEGVARPATDTALQIDKADGTPWTAEEVAAARQVGVPLHASPDGRSLVARGADVGEDGVAVQQALEAAGAPPLTVSAVPVRAPLGITPSGGAPDRAVAGGVGGLGEAARAGAQQMLPAGAARTGGEAAFDIAAGAAGGVAGAATAPEDATWQERAKRGIAGATAASLAGPTARAGLGALGRSGALDTFGAAAGRTPGRAEGALTRVPELISAIPLAAPTSLAANLTGGMARTIERVLGVAAEGRPIDAVVDLTAMAKSLLGGKALKAGRRAFSEGPTEANPGMTGALTPDDLAASTNWLARGATSGVKANAATDEFWRTLNEAGARAQATRRGVADPEAYATRAGDFATFTGSNSVVAKKLTEMKQTVRDPNASGLDRGIAAAVTSMAPYVMMPERLLRATIGALIPIESATGMVRAYLKGDKVAGREMLGRTIAGLATTSWLTYHYFNGGVTGDRPEDANEARRREARGEQWNTIQTPTGRVPSRFFGSFGMQANAVATTLDAARRAKEKGGDPGAVLENGFNGAARWFLDASYLSDLSEFGEDVRGPEGAAGALRNVAAGLPSRITGPVTGMIGAKDEYEREAEGFPEQVAMRTGLREALPARIDPTTGEAQRRRGSGWERYWGTRGSQQTPEGSELARLRVTPRVIGRTEEYLGAVRSREDRRKVQQILGSETARTVRRTMNATYYKNAKDVDKKGYLEDAIREAAKAAEARLWKLGIRKVGKSEAEEAAELESAF